MAKSYFKAYRSKNFAELLRAYPNAFLLFTLVAYSAKRSESTVSMLQVGQCYVNHINCGLSEQEYRTAKKVLTKLKLCKFKATNKTTVATILVNDIYNINSETSNGHATGKNSQNVENATGKNYKITKKINKEQRTEELDNEYDNNKRNISSNRQATDSQQTSNGQPTVNKNVEEEKEIKEVLRDDNFLNEFDEDYIKKEKELQQKRIALLKKQMLAEKELETNSFNSKQR